MARLTFFILAWCCLWLAACMFTKRSLHDPLVPNEKRFRESAENLFLDNTVSAVRTASLLKAAQDAGAKHVRDLAKVAAHLFELRMSLRLLLNYA